MATSAKASSRCAICQNTDRACWSRQTCSPTGPTTRNFPPRAGVSSMRPRSAAMPAFTENFSRRARANFPWRSKATCSRGVAGSAIAARATSRWDGRWFCRRRVGARCCLPATVCARGRTWARRPRCCASSKSIPPDSERRPGASPRNFSMPARWPRPFSRASACRQPRRYTASERLVKVKSRRTIGGIMLPLARSGFPSASMLLSMMTGLSLKRMFLMAYLIAPFSM